MTRHLSAVGGGRSTWYAVFSAQETLSHVDVDIRRD
jgi:hypothetical protein